MSKKVTVKKVVKEKKAKGPTIGGVCKENILAGLGWEASKAIIDKKFPGNKHSKACYYWYRNDMKQNDVKVPVLVRAKKDKPAKKVAVKKVKGKKALPTQQTTNEALAGAEPGI